MTCCLLCFDSLGSSQFSCNNFFYRFPTYNFSPQNLPPQFRGKTGENVRYLVLEIRDEKFEVGNQVKKPRIKPKVSLENSCEKTAIINLTAYVPFAHACASANGTHSKIRCVLVDSQIQNRPNA